MSKHLDQDQRQQLAAILNSCGAPEVLRVVAGWVNQNVGVIETPLTMGPDVRAALLRLAREIQSQGGKRG